MQHGPDQMIRYNIGRAAEALCKSLYYLLKLAKIPFQLQE